MIVFYKTVHAVYASGKGCCFDRVCSDLPKPSILHKACQSVDFHEVEEFPENLKTHVV